MFTLLTASVGVLSSCQLATTEAGDVCKIKDFFTSVLIATSPTSAVKANIATSVATTKVSVIAILGITLFASFPLPFNTGTLPLAVPIVIPDPSPFTNCSLVAVIAVPPVTKPFVS